MVSKEKHTKVQNCIWNRKGKAFQFAALKWAVHGYGHYGGAKYKRWLKAKYGLQESKEKGRVMLQKIRVEKKAE